MRSEVARLFNQIAVDTHISFTEWIDSISRQHAKNIDWWVSSPASQNTSISPLFHYCCCIALLQELIRANEPVSEITTDSRAFRKIIGDYLTKLGVNARVTSARLSVKQRLKELVRPIYVVFGLFLKQLRLFLAAQLTRSLRKPLPSEPLTLIDTFAIPGYIEKDRYYPGMLDALSENQKQRVWFVPHLYGFHPWQYLSVVKRLRKAERNFLLKTDFLKLRDYWCLWQHLFRIRKLQIKPSFFCGVDISLLVREELRGFKGLASSYISLLNYYFAKRLKEANVKLRFVINWFENQSIDRGWNAGFRRFFPEVETMGLSTHDLRALPTEVEKDSRVIPYEVAVVGKGLVQSVRRFCSDLDVCIAPAFRFQHVWQERKYFPAGNVYTVLVALPIVISLAVHILKLLVCKNSNGADIRFWIKLHPAKSMAQIKAAYRETWPEQFEFVGGDFYDCVEKSNLLISAASSTCMETLAKGIPVIVAGSNSGLTYNPVPETLTDDIWRLCYTSQEMEDAIQFYKSRSREKIREHEAVGKRIREEYFEPVTSEAVRRLLGLQTE